MRIRYILQQIAVSAVLCFLLLIDVTAQVSGVQWKRNFDTATFNLLEDLPVRVYSNNKLVQTNDGHFVFAARSNNDIAIYKVDMNGALLWKKIFGGSGTDIIHSLSLSHDGGFILAGQTFSNNGSFSGNHGAGDAFIAKTSSDGNVEWTRLIGGSLGDRFVKVEAIEGGYIAFGETMSEDGDITGNAEYTDMLMTKFDLNGNPGLIKTIGTPDCDKLFSFLRNKNGGYILAGLKASPGCDMGSPLQKVLIGVNENGIQSWSSSIPTTPDLGFVSNLTFNGDSSRFYGIVKPYMGVKPWLYEFNAGTGAIITGKQLNDIQVTTDFNAVALVRKPNGHFVMTLASPVYLTGFDQNTTYIAELDGSGNVLLQKQLNFGDETIVNAQLVQDGVLLLSNNFNRVGLSKFVGVNEVTGRVFLDLNGDSQFTEGETTIDGIRVTSSQGEDSQVNYTHNGRFRTYPGSGTIVTTIQTPLEDLYNITPAQHISTFNGYFNSDTIDIALTPRVLQQDLKVAMLGLTASRPGFSTTYQIIYKNNGTVTLPAYTIKLVKDSRLSVLNASVPFTSVVNDTIIWDFSSLIPMEADTVLIEFTVAAPPAAQNGDTLKSSLTILPFGNDFTPADNTTILKQVVTGSYDPNDKTESNAGIITPGQVSGGEYLTYLIRFQNVGTDTAFNIIVRDTLDEKLDWNSLEMISASHSNSLEIKEGNRLKWTFNNILLADSNVNEPRSHGYVAYRIRPAAGVLPGDTIRNTASIYFDFNLPVATNMAKTLISNNSPLPVHLIYFKADRNANVVDLGWKTATEDNASHFEIQRASSRSSSFTTIGLVNALNLPRETVYSFRDDNPVAGYNYYRLKSVDRDGSSDFSSTAIVNYTNDIVFVSSINPNPTRDNLNIILTGEVDGIVKFEVTDFMGRLLVSKSLGRQKVSSLQSQLSLSSLANGTYVLRIWVGNRLQMHKVLIQ